MYATNSKVVFDCNNEPHDMGSASVPNLMQACINGVRAAGATSQYIFVEGTVSIQFHLQLLSDVLAVLLWGLDLDDHFGEHQSRLANGSAKQNRIRDAPVPVGIRGETPFSFQKSWDFLLRQSPTFLVPFFEQSSIFPRTFCVEQLLTPPSPQRL